jgi:hypothetical protein
MTLPDETYLTGHLTSTQLRKLLEDLPFDQHRHFASLRIDREVRNVFVSLLRQHTRTIEDFGRVRIAPGAD